MANDSTDDDDRSELGAWRTAAYLQWFRVTALAGLFVAEVFVELAVLAVVLALELAIEGGLLVSVRGVRVPILRVAETTIVGSVLWTGVKLKMTDQPAFSRIEP